MPHTQDLEYDLENMLLPVSQPVYMTLIPSDEVEIIEVIDTKMNFFQQLLYFFNINRK